MINWNFNANEYEEKSFENLKPGDYRVRIKDVEEMTSKNTGNPMLKITFEVSGKTNLLWKYIVFDPTNSKQTNQMLGEIYNAFGIPKGNLNAADWLGKTGGARVKIDNDPTYGAKSVINYFLRQNQVDKLPPWVDPPQNISEHQASQNTPPQGYYGTPPMPNEQPPLNTNDLL